MLSGQKIEQLMI